MEKSNKMYYKTLGNSALKVSEVSFGCMSLSSSGTENDALIGEAIAGGINLFDTADLYEKGENEKLLGRALKGRREEVLISTKVGNKWRADGSGWDWYPRKEYILSAIDDSLQRLQTDYIDLYLLHGGTIEDPIDEVIEAFEKLKEQGKIREYGLSSIRPNIIREYVNRSGIAAVMTQYSLLDRRPEEATLQLLQDNDIGVMARGTIASGLLAGKPPVDYLGMDSKRVAEVVTSVKSKLPHGRDLQEAAVRYAADNPAVTTAVAGIRTQEQLQAAIAAANSNSLTQEEWHLLNSAWKGNVYEQHR